MIFFIEKGGDNAIKINQIVRGVRGRWLKGELEGMQAEAKNPAKMVHVNKRRLQSYSEFIQGYKVYKQEKKSSSTSLQKH